MKISINWNKLIREVLNAALFIFLLHLIIYIDIRIATHIALKYSLHMTEPNPDEANILPRIFHALVYFYIPSIAGLILFLFFERRGKYSIGLFLLAILALLPVFVNIEVMWRNSTWYICNPKHYLITISRFVDITFSTVFLLYSIIPIILISKRYAKSQIIWVVVMFILSLYTHTFFFGNYYTLFFKPVYLPF